MPVAFCFWVARQRQRNVCRSGYGNVLCSHKTFNLFLAKREKMNHLRGRTEQVPQMYFKPKTCVVIDEFH